MERIISAITGPDKTLRVYLLKKMVTKATLRQLSFLMHLMK